MCYFAHPSDGEQWNQAKPSGEPPLHYLTDDEYRLIVGRHRSPGRGPATRPAQPYQPRRRSRSPERERRSPPRKYERSPVRGRSPERGYPNVPLATRLREHSATRDGYTGRPYGFRSSRSRSPASRGRMQARTPPPPMSGTRSYGTISDGPPKNQQIPMKGSAVFPKSEPVDISMRDLMPYPPAIHREDSISSAHGPSHHATPSRIPTGPSAMNGGSYHAKHSSSSTIVSSSATQSGISSTAIGSTLGHGSSSSMNSLVRAESSGSAKTAPDPIMSLLESSTAQWQQISSAVAAATSAVPKSSVQSSVVGDAVMDDSQRIWASRVE